MSETSQTAIHGGVKNSEWRRAKPTPRARKTPKRKPKIKTAVNYHRLAHSTQYISCTMMSSFSRKFNSSAANSRGQVEVKTKTWVAWQKMLSEGVVPSYSHWLLFLICRRARRQRSQSPILVTVRIDKHIKLYNEWSLRVKSKSSQSASQVMESTSTFLFIAQSDIRKASTVQSSYSKISHHSWL